MLNSPFFRRLFVPSLLLIIGATATVGFVAARIIRAGFMQRQTDALRDGVQFVSYALAPQVTAGLHERIQDEARRLGQSTGKRITVMREDGVVVADSEADLKTIENHKARPEFVSAAAGGEGMDTRTSETIKQPLLYLARPVKDTNGQIAHAPNGQAYYVRLAAHLDELRNELRALYTALAAAAVMCSAFAGAICYVFAKRSARPISELTQFANALSHGDLARRAVPEQTGEVSTLATTLNTMAESLSTLIAQANKDKAELLTIVSSMSEGLIATDIQQRILLVNEAAGKLLGFDTAKAVGKHLWEVVRNDFVIKAASEVLKGSQRKLISVEPTSARHVDVTLCTYPTEGQVHGLVMVAHDITQSVQYQELRKEFVANVSHELRTPLTVIKGFVETLLDGAVRDESKASEYLGTILKHTNQLTNLVSDLLELSKLESHGLAPARRAPVDLGLVIRKACDLFMPAAQRKTQMLTIKVDDRLPTIKGNADYLERAVANLIDNASKYTPEGGKIDVSAKANGSYVVLQVADNGIGIPREDIPRIFERFYRVDRSRSREMGGTGLGLSIVKHVAQVHGGTIEVESTPGKGSTFKLKLPVT